MTWFTVDEIKDYENVFNSICNNKTKLAHVSQLKILLRTCGASPTRKQVTEYEESIDKEEFTFGDFLDIMAQHMSTKGEIEMNDMLYSLFAYHDNHLGNIKEGYVRIEELLQVFCQTGPDPVHRYDLEKYLEKQGVPKTGLIPITKFMEVFGKKLTTLDQENDDDDDD